MLIRCPLVFIVTCPVIKASFSQAHFSALFLCIHLVKMYQFGMFKNCHLLWVSHISIFSKHKWLMKCTNQHLNLHLNLLIKKILRLCVWVHVTADIFWSTNKVILAHQAGVLGLVYSASCGLRCPASFQEQTDEYEFLLGTYRSFKISPPPTVPSSHLLPPPSHWWSSAILICKYPGRWVGSWDGKPGKINYICMWFEGNRGPVGASI